MVLPLLPNIAFQSTWANAAIPAITKSHPVFLPCSAGVSDGVCPTLLKEAAHFDAYWINSREGY